MRRSALLVALSIAGFCLSLQAQTTAPFNRSTFQSRVTTDVSRVKSSKVEGGDFDDMRDRISFKLKFRNSDPNKAFDGLKYELFIFGQSMVNRKAYRLLQRSKGEFCIPPLKEYETESPEVVTEWDDTNAIFGEKYKGWYLYVYGPDGSLLVEKSVSAIFPPMVSMDNLVEGKYYDKDMKPVSKPGERH